MKNDPHKELRWFFTAFLFVFILFKLADITAIANWSWVWVLSPFWIPLTAGIFTILFKLTYIWIKRRRNK